MKKNHVIKLIKTLIVNDILKNQAKKCQPPQ